MNANITKLIGSNTKQSRDNPTIYNIRENTDQSMLVDPNNEVSNNNGCNVSQTNTSSQNETTSAQIVTKNKNQINHANNQNGNSPVVTMKSIGEKNGLLSQISSGRSVTLLGAGGTKIKISADTAEHRVELIGFLKQNKYNFHTFCPANEKRLDIVIKGRR